MKKYTLLRTFMLFIAALILCGWFSIHTQAAITKGVKAPEQTVCFEPDTTSVLKNPLTGWVMYLGRAWDENFWQTQRYDRKWLGFHCSCERLRRYMLYSHQLEYA